jgi:hypothetical protein
MILIVGHGPSADRVPHSFIDEQWVVRLRTWAQGSPLATPKYGTKIDCICSSELRFKKKSCEFWYLAGALRKFCVDALRPFNPNFWKPSTGLSAAIIARDRFPDAEIGVIGFDYTMHPDKTQNWRHDQFAECECIKTLGVIDICNDLDTEPPQP